MLVSVDAKSLEWCTYLFLSQDRVGIDEWHGVVTDPTKNDIHRANQDAFKLPSRLIAKVFLFRWIYRGPAFAYSRDPDFMGVSRKVDFWQDVIDRYYDKYRDLYKTHLQYIQQVKDTGKLVSPLGRSYQFEPKLKRGEYVWSEPDICNWINQGLGADVMAVARIVAFQQMKKRNFKSLLMSTVHDSLTADCPKEEVDEVNDLFLGVFRELPSNISKAYGINWNIPMVGETSKGHHMSDCH